MSIADRKKSLLDAQKKAEQLFAEAEHRQLIAAGKNEKTLNTDMYELAFEMFGIRKYWHKRIVRAGKNTLFPYRENPPDLMIQSNDILFFDFGPVFEEWEADFGRTYVLGSDERKHKLKNDIESAWCEGKKYFDAAYPEITGAEYFKYISSLASQYGWEFGNIHCGHLIGNFPHEIIQGEEKKNYLHPENNILLSAPDDHGNPRDWILEIHFIDKEHQFGGFFEQLLTT
ncbi:MAG: M24 family metallopeptidase [Bacteroidota bacterium]|nr:M24 family metallopeptidase [Bacteroidota bacterium]